MAAPNLPFFAVNFTPPTSGPIINLADLTVFKNKKSFVHTMVRTVRDSGGMDFWVLNKHHLEIYQFKITQVSEFDIQIDIVNSLLKEDVFSGVFVLHMKDNLVKIMDEVPGVVYLKKLECYRELYGSLYDKAARVKSPKNKCELIEKIEFIEMEFPQFVI